MATVIVGLIVAAVLFLAARQLYVDKKNGKSSCGGNCSCCPNGCACYTGNCHTGDCNGDKKIN
ncbi:MAG: FeoB-associated Cys-rich membrane protein [Oscillospiraceae bacterium]|nr:FeoB-associated Cys-rich membrane protein [Oscillospiraceae bacterium]